MNAVLATPYVPPARPIVQRFLWKEYRMLRGFWLAVGALALVVQFVLPYFLYDARMVGLALLATAWGAAALYAVGAAITLFSAEHEEHTHDFLVRLPTRWLPMFVGKLSLALVSALALALALSLSGYFLAGGNWPDGSALRGTLAVAGLAIVEATVWGMFFSLLMRQPLLAAILAMAAASLGAQLAVATTRAGQTFLVDAYVLAAPRRLLLCLVVFLIDMRIAARWLQPQSQTKTRTKKLARRASEGAVSAPSLARRAGLGIVATPSRRRMFARLLWQTWRESWPTMLAAVPIALLLMVCIVAMTWLAETQGVESFATVLCCPLLLPALWGALVFRADQHGEQRQFLVAHAARPRWIWLARQVVWLTALVTIGWTIQLAFSWGLGTYAVYRLHDLMGSYYYDQFQINVSWQNLWQIEHTVSMYWQISALVWCAFLAAYGIGQLCSLLLRREVLAGFLALLLSVVLTAWTAVIGLWKLSPWWFVLPIVVVTLWATWLRAPDWLVGRNRLRAWWKPIAAMTLPMIGVLALLPSARLDQLPPSPFYQDYKYLQATLPQSLKARDTNAAAARKTATQYEQVFASLVPWNEATKDVELDGQRFEDLEFLEQDTEFGGGGEYGGKPFTPEQLELLRRFETLNRHALAAANQAAITELETLSQRPAAKFSTNIVVGKTHPWGFSETLEELLLYDASRLLAEQQLEPALQRLLCIARMRGQLLSNQTSTTCQDMWYSFNRRDDLEPTLLQWAQHPAQTSDQIKTAIAELQAIYDAYPDPRQAVLADYEHVRDILLEKEPPTFLQAKQEHRRAIQYLPFLANRLPWERQRGLRALDLLTTQRLNYVDAVSFATRGGDVWELRKSRRYHLADLLRRNSDNRAAVRNEVLCEGDWRRFVRLEQIADQCATSYLTADELANCGELPLLMLNWVDEQIAQQGLLTQLALLAYQIDHGAYPETLAQLVPDYLTRLPRDPYTREPFEYRPAGLELPLARHNNFLINPDTPLSWLISPGTPLFWSVGYANNELRQQLMSVADDDLNEESGSKLVYQFKPTSSYWISSRNQVFPLPKIAEVSQEALDE